MSHHPWDDVMFLGYSLSQSGFQGTFKRPNLSHNTTYGILNFPITLGLGHGRLLIEDVQIVFPPDRGPQLINGRFLILLEDQSPVSQNLTQISPETVHSIRVWPFRRDNGASEVLRVTVINHKNRHVLRLPLSFSFLLTFLLLLLGHSLIKGSSSPQIRVINAHHRKTGFPRSSMGSLMWHVFGFPRNTMWTPTTERDMCDIVFLYFLRRRAHTGLRHVGPNCLLLSQISPWIRSRFSQGPP